MRQAFSGLRPPVSGLPAFLYFAYGSNLLAARLRQRAPSARALGPARLDGHALAFHKRGLDGSGKATLLKGDGAVHGALYRVDQADRAALDRAEAGYDAVEVRVETAGGFQTAWTYLAQPERFDPRLHPFDWYMALTVAGAKAHGLPSHYVVWLEAVPSVADPDRGRATEHLRLLNG